MTTNALTLSTPLPREELARRAVACTGWRWMPGMQTNSKFARVVAVDSTTGVPCAAEQGATNDDCHAVWMDDVPLLPDLTDPATLGCLLALVREVHGPSAVARHIGASGRGGQEWAICDRARLVDGSWQAAPDLVEGWSPDLGYQYWESEAAALVAALECAP